jgi:hypothetical protein
MANFLRGWVKYFSYFKVELTKKDHKSPDFSQISSEIHTKALTNMKKQGSKVYRNPVAFRSLPQPFNGRTSPPRNNEQLLANT